VTVGDWSRATRELAFENLPQDLQASIRQHLERYNLGDILADSLMSIETSSEKVRRGLLGKGRELVVMAAVVTPRWLVWAIRGNSADVTVMSARLAEVVIQDYADTKFAKMVPDAGMEVSGSFTDVADRGAAFIGLGPEAASEEFKRTAITAAQSAKKN
jgi:hypothetical protein